MYFLKLYSRIGEGEKERKGVMIYYKFIFEGGRNVEGVGRGGGAGGSLGKATVTILDIAALFRCTHFYKLWGISMS